MRTINVRSKRHSAVTVLTAAEYAARVESERVERVTHRAVAVLPQLRNTYEVRRARINAKLSDIDVAEILAQAFLADLINAAERAIAEAA